MIAILVTAMVCGFGVWLVREAKLYRADERAHAEALARERTIQEVSAQTRYTVDDRDRLQLERDRLQLDRERFNAEQARQKPTKVGEPMPGDLIARYTRWEEEWAQDDERRRLQGLYADLGSWDLVRTAVGSDDRIQTGVTL